MVVRRGIRQPDDDQPAVGLDDFNMAAVQVGEHLGGHDLLGCAHPEPSAGQVQDPVHVVHDRVDLVGHEHHGAVRVAALPVDQRADALLVLKVKGEQRLVAQQHLGIGREGLRHAQALLLTAGELPHRHLGVIGGAHKLQEFIDFTVHLGAAEADAPAVAVDAEGHEVAGAQGRIGVE